jgi:hypothetical protein
MGPVVTTTVNINVAATDKSVVVNSGVAPVLPNAALPNNAFIDPSRE